MDGYSRIVAWLKVLLPVTALGLLSTLFLISRSTEQTAAIPFAEAELADRVRREQVTEPFFSGMTQGGDQVMIMAQTMRTSLSAGSEAADLTAQIDLTSGTRVNIVSDTGQFDMVAGQSTLSGDVVITTSDGLDIRTDRLLADFDQMRLTAPRTVATGPFGRLESGAMRLERPDTGESAHFVFTDGVKLIYSPNSKQE